MPRDATLTREKLVSAGEQRFARDGVAGARLRDIVRDAGQANDAAVSYHFESRAGLLRAIVEKHMRVMEAERLRSSSGDPGKGLTDLVRLIVLPTAALLKTPEGRDFLRIIVQLAALSGVRAGQPAELIKDTALAEQLTQLEDLLAQRLPAETARERVAALVTFLTGSLAERARAVEHSSRQILTHQRYVDELVAMLAAAMAA